MAGCRAPALHVCIPGGWWWIPDGWWCIPDGWWCIPGGLWCDPRWLVVHPWWLVVHPGILGRILQPGTQAGARTHSPSAAALAVEIQVSKE